MLNLFEMFVTLHAQFCMFLESVEFLEFVCWMRCFSRDVEFISSPAERTGFHTSETAVIQDVTSPCWLVKRASGTLESTLFDLCCSRLSPSPQTGVLQLG